MRFNPVTVGRQRAHLIRITNPTENVPLEKLGAEVVAWENRICDFESRPSADKVSDSVKMAALTTMCPNGLREHLQLNASRFTSYYELGVFRFLDYVLPVATTAMDIGSLNVQRCWNCGSTQHYARDCTSGKGKGGGKGKSKGGKGSGKGKSGKDGGKKGKGKSFSKSKGKDGKASKGHKGYQDYKPLNAVTADPHLGQLQSQYAKAALDAYNREKAALIVPPTLAPSPPLAWSSSPSGSGGPAQVIGVRSLFALGPKPIECAECPCHYSVLLEWPQLREDSRLLRQMMRGAYLVEATIDSGAAASVRPPHIFEEYERFPAEDQYFVAANGDLVPELYQVRPVIATQEGLTRFWSQQLRFAIGATGSSLINRGDGLTLKMAPLET